MAKFCSNCGQELVEGQAVCLNCGVLTKDSTPNQNSDTTVSGNKQKMTAGLFAILLGSLGVHKFYLGRPGMGVLYILFSWTGIPGIVSLIEGILYLTMSDKEFFEKYH